MKKTLLVAAVALSALFAGAANAQDLEGSVNVAVTSDYIWRGVTQSGGDAAVQGGIDLKKGMLYGGAWASYVDFGTNDSTELDLYAGLTPTAGDYSFDFGVITYLYNGDSDSATELKAAVSHPWGKGTVGGAMYLDAETLEDPYLEINASYPLTDKLSLSGAIGQCGGALCNGLGDYTTYNVGATYAINENIAIDLRYSDLSRHTGAKSATFVTLKGTF